jgi:type II secretory pathway pseudopilin PulG
MRMRRLGRARRRLFRDDRGFTIVEVCVAAFIMAIGVTTVMAAMGGGMGLVGHSRQRSAGAGVAQERLERARNVAYPDLALNEDPSHSNETGHPDNNVIENGPGPEDDQYQLPNTACATPPCVEPLIINTTSGGLKHLDDPFTLANTDFTVHQFVTWARDDATGDTEPTISGVQSYKRVTIVVKWKFPVHSGPSHTVTESTFVGDGNVTLPSPSATPSPTPAASPTAPPSSAPVGVGTFLGSLSGNLTPPASGTGPCTSDTTPPILESAQLLSGSATDPGYLNSTSVQLRFEGQDLECHPIYLYMANKPTTNDCLDASGWVEVRPFEDIPPGDPSPVTVSWTIPSGDGIHAICGIIRNKANDLNNRRSQVWGVTVLLDQTKPPVPGNFRKQNCTISGNDRVATFNWDAGSPADVNHAGYRLYRSVESGPYQAISTTQSLALPDTSPKNYASVRYFVRAFDKAGNESTDSSVISFAKNQC